MVYWIVGIVTLVIDILTKIWAKAELSKVKTIPLWEKVFHFTYVENRGIAFGMFGGGRIFFILLTVVILGILLWFYRKNNRKTAWLHLGTSLVISGALGNLIDRIFRGYVVDFLDFRWIDFPVFNVADIAVCVGAVMLVIHCFQSEEKKEDEAIESGADMEDGGGR